MITYFDSQPRFELTGEFNEGRALFKLLEDYTLYINNITVTVPAGFKTDFASVPRFLWSIFPPSGEYAPAAIVHDYLYSSRATVSRFLADAIFHEAMESALKVPFWKRKSVYWAVRLFGGSHFKT